MAKKREREKEERKLVITMAKLRMAHASTHGARKPPGPKKREREKEERKLVKTMAKLRMAHASTYGARKPPGPIDNGSCFYRSVKTVNPF